ncbi:MAG: hypothetical protein O2875_07675 [Planctomycetota bacterium]|nr:hypothetical protein [Planctomycetota bacterium]MDA1262728.1 hypothetical protein [Planctomycetota bacterium]
MSDSASPANSNGHKFSNDRGSLKKNPFGIDPRWSIPLIGSLLAIASCVWVVAAELLPIAFTLFTSQSQNETTSAMSKAIEQHEELIKVSVDRFTGRSLFMMPSPPPRPAPPTPAPVAPPPPPPPPPPPVAPSEYTGTKPTGVLGSLVFFGSDLTILVGEEKNGIKVLAVEPPFNMKIGHMGGTYSVSIWEPTDLTKLSMPFSKSSTRTPPIVKVQAEQTKSVTNEKIERPNPANPATPPVAITPPIQIETAVDTGDEPDPDSSDAERATPRIVAPVSPRSSEGFTSSGQTQPPPVPPTIPSHSESLQPITAEQISTMSQGDVASALARVARARQTQGLDQATQDRLRSEFGLLRERQSSFNR